MRSKRAPDRVHVVRTPEQDGFALQDGRSIEIVRMLAQISDKLKRSEAERYELLGELREYRSSLRELEDKAEVSEKVYRAIETKLQTKGSVDTESYQRQVRFEKTLRATEEKMVKTIAGQALIDRRLKDTEDRQIVIDQRLDQSVSEQVRLDRQLELTSQDKSRLLRKVERLEEMVTDTQDTLQAKAMVLLTDQSVVVQAGLKAPAWNVDNSDGGSSGGGDHVWWKKALNMQTVGMTSMIVAALLGGWTINQIQQPQVQQIAVLENGGLAKLNLEGNRWEPITGNAQTLNQPSEITDLGTNSSEAPTSIFNATLAPEINPADVLDYNDEQLLAALNSNPDKLASQLNDIAPSMADASKSIEDAVVASPSLAKTMRDFEKLAYVQDSKIKKTILAEKSNASLASRVKPDTTLPNVIKTLEIKAFQGNAAAQHDLAAAYTAGHDGVDQDFEKAAFWFREASDGRIANARYNLGVLYHQGLGKDRDLGRALYWYREAAKLDHAEAQYNLGIAHIEGIGTTYDPRLAAGFFEKAANNGVMEAAYNLGLIYENGLLGEAKPNDALLWYKISADQGSADAKIAMEQLAKNLQIGMDDVDVLVKRMQSVNQSATGRKAGPIKKAPAANSDRALVSQVQEYLILVGAYNGAADGIRGPQTKKAIKMYQTANGLSADGTITKELLDSMVSNALERVNYE